MFFEGSEKKVEIVIGGADSLRPHKEFWEQVVARANATVLSTISSNSHDAYLLSESSLFVFRDRVIMITCGTTSLTDAIEEIIRFVGVETIELLMYERKNEHNPEAQPSSFEDDISKLRGFIPGEVIRFGESDGTRVFLFHYARPTYEPHGQDMTLEILMHELSDSVRENFSCETTLPTLYQRTDINQIFDGYECDDFLFEPMGYSVNAVKEKSYYTFHVTPEKACSYASFETNHIWNGNYNSTINKVLGIFKPKKFALVLFHKEGKELSNPIGYQAVKETRVTSCGYQILFRDFRLIEESPDI